MYGPKLSSTPALLSVVVAVCVVVCTGPSDVWARQFMTAGCAGDPGDGSEAELSSSGYGAPDYGVGGDPTDGNGWTYPESHTTAEPCHMKARERDDRVDARGASRARFIALKRWLDLARELCFWHASPLQFSVGR